MDQIEAEGLILQGSRLDLLAQFAGTDRAESESGLRGFEGLTGSRSGLIALGDPASVPRGQVWEADARGSSPLRQAEIKIGAGQGRSPGAHLRRDRRCGRRTGLRDRCTDFATSTGSGTSPGGSHDPIVYPLAEIHGSRNDSTAREFIAFLQSPAARAIFERHGFRMA